MDAWRNRLVLAALLATAHAAACTQPGEDGPGPRPDADGGDDGRSDTGGDANPDGRDDGIPDWTTDETECVQDLDIVFVLDVSTSMTPVLSALRDGIADVWTRAVEISPDPWFGLVVFVDDVRVTNEGRTYATMGTLQNEFEYWREFCSSNREPGGSSGFNNDCPENSLDALWEAANRFPWRPDSLRMIILATDDTFVERPQTLGSADIMVQRTYPEVLAALREREIRVAAFAARESSNCGIPPLHDTEPGFFTPYGADPPLPEATGAPVFDIMNVMSGSVSMAEAIGDVILDEYCTPYPI